MHHDYIPFSVPDIGSEEIAEVVETLQSGWLTTGERTHKFEAEFCHYTGASHALGLNSCTAALHLALVGLGIGSGDEVITTPLTFCATVNTILHVGATPVLADVQEDGNIDPREIERHVTDQTRAIMPVHLGGLACDMDAIWKISQERDLRVVEDAAHAIGTLYRGEHLGSQSSPSDAVAYSFYATKNITTGEGGMVTTNSKALSARMRMLALHGISRDAWKRYRQDGSWYYEVLEPGFKYNLADLQSAIGIHQLRKLEKFIVLRAERAALYGELLADVEELELPTTSAECRHAWHLYMVRLNLNRTRLTRNEFIEELRVHNIGTSVHFIPVPLHPFFANWKEAAIKDCPRAMALYQRMVSLPLYPSLRHQDVVRIAASVKQILANASKKSTVPVRMVS